MMNATINQLLEALHLAQTALNIQPRFRVHNTDSYRIAAQVDAALAAAEREGLTKTHHRRTGLARSIGTM